MERGLACGFKKVSEPMWKLLQNVSCTGNFFQSLVIRNLLQKERNSDNRDQQNGGMRYDRIWWLPVQSEMLTKVYQHQDVEWDKVHLTKDDPDKASADLSSPWPRKWAGPRLRWACLTCTNLGDWTIQEVDWQPPTAGPWHVRVLWSSSLEHPTHHPFPIY